MAIVSPKNNEIIINGKNIPCKDSLLELPGKVCAGELISGTLSAAATATAKATGLEMAAAIRRIKQLKTRRK